MSLTFVRVSGATMIAMALLALFPDVALACPVCFDSSDENRQAFIATTAFLSLLPLGMVGGAGLYIRKRSRELDEISRLEAESPNDLG